MSPARGLRGWCMRLAGMFNQQKRDRDLAAEMDAHLQLHVEDNLRAGMTPEEARTRALQQLGGVEYAKEEYRMQRGIPWIETTMKDLRYAARMLLRSPGFTAVAVLSLALGIGANTAIFSLVNLLLLRPLPVAKPEQLVLLSNSGDAHSFPTFSYPNYKDFRDKNDVFSGLVAYRFSPLSLSHDGVNEKLWGFTVSGNYFEVLGVNATLGRVIQPEDDRMAGAHPVTVLSDSCWRRRFGADPGVIGKNVIVNGKGYTVIGVAPRGFYGTEVIVAPEMWFPMAMQEQIEVGDRWLDKRDKELIFLIGRLKPGVGVAQAQTALNAIAAQLEHEFPEINEGKRVTLTTPGFAGRGFREAMLGFAVVLMVVVAFVLLLACLNLANLLLARAIERRKEISVRLAMGASRGRLVRQLMAESLLLSVAGGVLGCLPAFWLIRMAATFKPPVDFPLLFDLHLDYRVLLFNLLMSLLTGMLFGLLPALQATRMDAISAMKDEVTFAGARRSWLKNGLVAFQLALSLVLLVGGGLMVRALQNAQNVPLGFNPQNALEVSFDLKLQGYDEKRGFQFQKLLLERVRALPRVQHAGLVDLAPVDLHFPRSAVFIEGQTVERTAKAPQAMTNRGGPGYFQAMGTRLVKGRDFTESDADNAPKVVIINEAFARRFWPGQDPIGKRFSRSAPDSPKMEVIGVVQDGKYAGLGDDAPPYFCRPILQDYSGATTVIVRTESDPQAMLAQLRKEVLALEPTMPISSARPLIARMAVPLLPARVAAALLGSFGILALVLVAIGIYGIMSHAVSKRTHEIGVRMALGARASQVLSLTVGQGMKLVLIGVAIGLPAALLLARLIRRMLYGVSAADWPTYAGVSAMLLGVALLACFIPARRATRIDPMAALRNE